jgi:hypothetical protein
MGQLKSLGVPIAVMAIATAIQGFSPVQAIAYAPPKAEAGTAATVQQHIGTVESSADGSFASSEVAPGRFEVTFSGTRFESRDRVERYLLYRAALLAKQNGASWFGLLYLPGEAGPDSHPARSSPTGQHHYGHWQPHWNYYVSGLGWNPWHPEWGAAFWADSIDLSRVERYDAHAMIELGINSRPSGDQPIFDVGEVMRDLEPAFR